MKELCRKYNFPYYRLCDWIQKGWVRSVERMVDIAYETGWGGKRWSVTYKRPMYFVDEESFLEIPTFLRNKTNKTKKK